MTNEQEEAKVPGAAPVSGAESAEDAATTEAVEAPEATNGTHQESDEDRAERLKLREADVEAVLFSSEIPLTVQKLGSVLDLPKRDLLEIIDHLNVFYGETGRAFRITPLAGGFQLVTTADHAELLGRMHKERVPTRLSRAALETLAIIAFKQPVTRSEVDAIRGVSASDRVLRHLMERKLVRIAGRAEAPGRPLLYGTTREFLGYFGLTAVADLPRTDELESLLAGDLPASASNDEDWPEEMMEAAAKRGVDPAEIPAAVAMSGMMDEALAEEGESEVGPAEDEDVEDVVESHSGEESDDREGVPAPQ
jgi:segregation and condensation protein B